MARNRLLTIAFSFVVMILISTFAFAADIVNVNTADHEQLQTLKNVGAARAAAIIAYREANGPFKSFDDLKQVKGIGDGIIAANEDMIIFQEGAAEAANPCAANPCAKSKDMMSGSKN